MAPVGFDGEQRMTSRVRDVRRETMSAGSIRKARSGRSG